MAGDNFWMNISATSANATMFNEYSFLEWTYGLEHERIYVPLNEYISLNGYNFPEWLCFPWTRIYFHEWTNKFFEMGYNSVNEYNCLEWLYFLWKNICSLNEFISLTVNKYIISLKLNKYDLWSCTNIQLLDVKLCLDCKYILLNVNICISWILQPLQTANNSQLWMVTQTNTNYDLLILCVPCEQRPLVYHEKQRPLVSPRKLFMCPYDKSAIIIEICFFTKDLRSGL